MSTRYPRWRTGDSLPTPWSYRAELLTGPRGPIIADLGSLRRLWAYDPMVDSVTPLGERPFHLQPFWGVAPAPAMLDWFAAAQLLTPGITRRILEALPS